MARENFEITGIERVLSNINKEIRQIPGRSVKGLIHAQITVRRSMRSTPPIVPFEHGHLEQSYFMVASNGSQIGEPPTDDASEVSSSGEPLLAMGFTANYAAAVHEMLESKSGKKINWSRSGSGPKFLEAHLEMNRDEILKEIQNHAKYT